METAQGITRRSFLTGIVAAGAVSKGAAQVATGVERHERPLAKLMPLSYKCVHIEDRFWAPRQEVNRRITIPHCFRHSMLDHDLYKTMEAASYALGTRPDAALEKKMDETIAWIASTQAPDGYRNTHIEPEKKFKNLVRSHELYTAGHLFEAAVAYWEATGKRNFLLIATKFADLIDSVFGDAPGKRVAYDGHPEVELALVRLWRATGQQRYLDLATFFVNKRGSKFFAEEQGIPVDEYDGRQWQDDVPIREHNSINGHAVRAGYLFAGVTDVAKETGDSSLLRMLDRVWDSATERRMYITGGVGSRAKDEAFGEDYDLPNETAYQETCASVAMVLWSHRMALLYGDTRYADEMERVLYNAAAASVSLSGDKFFYVNPLSSNGNHHRREWFGTACCPPNAARLIASLGGYAYATSQAALWVNLYIQGSVTAQFPAGEMTLKVKTDYPWDGRVELSLQTVPAVPFGLRLRIPGWCSGASLKVNGSAVTDLRMERGYMVCDRSWRSGDHAELLLSMPVQLIEAHPLVREDAGHFAVSRGPLVYCFEGCDHQPVLHDLGIPAGTGFEAKWEPDVLDGFIGITGIGIAAEPTTSEELYRKARRVRKVFLKAIPYCLWDNRGPGPMRVWMPADPA